MIYTKQQQKENRKKWVEAFVPSIKDNKVQVPLGKRLFCCAKNKVTNKHEYYVGEAFCEENTTVIKDSFWGAYFPFPDYFIEIPEGLFED